MDIIPAIDVIEGRCVRLEQGSFSTKKTYHSDPVEVAQSFQDAGLLRLHLVDLDGAKSGRIINYRTLEKIASRTNLKIDFGGGVGSDEDLKIAFESGASQVTGGSIAVKQREVFLRWLEVHGNERIILGADVLDEKVKISGWQEESKIYLIDLLNDYQEKGIKYVICTDISKDGLLQGPSLDLYKKVRDEFPELKLIASGGVTSMNDLEALLSLGMSGAIIGKALYEGRIKLTDLAKFL